LVAAITVEPPLRKSLAYQAAVDAARRRRGWRAATATHTFAIGHVESRVALFQAIAKIGNVRGARIESISFVTSSNCETHH
jgi:hypothetical protein